MNTATNQPTPTAEVAPDAAVTLDADETAFLQLLGYTSLFEGCALAIAEVVACLHAAHDIFGHDRLQSRAERGKHFTARLKGLERNGQAAIGLPSSKATDRTAGDLLSDLPEPRLAPDALHRVRALMGLRSARHLSTGTTLPVEAVEAHISLLLCQAPRSRLHEDWRALSECVDLDEQGLTALKAKLKSAVVREVADELLVAHATAIAPDMAIPDPDSTPHHERQAVDDIDEDDDPDGAYIDQPAFTEARASAVAPFESSATPAAPPLASANNEEQKQFSLIGWRLVDASFAPLTRRMGITTGWGALPLADLSGLCLALKVAFLEGDEETRNFVFLAYHSQQWSLPPQLALTVPTDTAAPQHYNAATGRRVWPYAQLVGKDVDSADASSAIEWAPIEIECDPDIVAHGRDRLKAKPGSKSIAELVGAGRTPQEVTRFLKRYRKFLRSFGDNVHPPYAARFARSFGPAVKDITGSDVLAVFLATDTSMSAGGMPHYVTSTSRWLQQWNRAVHQQLGWKPPTETSDDETIGAGPALPLDRYLKGWTELQAETAEALAGLDAAHSLPAIGVAWTKLAETRLLSFGCLSGHRLTRIARLTGDALFGHPKYLCLSDKVSCIYDAYRLMPVTVRLAQMRDCLLSDLDRLLAAIERVDPESLRAAVVTAAPSKAVFFGLKTVMRNGHMRLKREALSVASLDAISQRHFERDRNIGRHTLVSWMVQANVDPWVIRVLTGHGAALAEVFGDAAAVAPQHLLDELKRELDLRLEDPGFAPYRHSDEFTAAMGFTRLHAVPLPAGDPYCHPRLERDGHILPAPADRYTTTSLAVVDAVRLLLLVPAREEDDTSLDRWAQWLITAICFDGLHHEDLREIFEGLPGTVVSLGRTVLAAWTREGRSNLCANSLLPPTLASLSRCDLANRPAWSSLLEMAGAWLRRELPHLAWPEGPTDALLSFVAMTGRWLRVHLSPAVYAASLRCVMSSTFSAHSLLRLASLKPAQVSSDVLEKYKALRPSASRQTSRKKRPAVDGIGTVLFKYQKTTGERHGENLARANKVLDALVGHDVSGDLPAEAALVVVRKEMALIQDVDQHRRDIGGLATYWTEVSIALKLVPANEDMRLWTAADWCEWVELATAALKLDARAKGKAAPELHGLQRFCRTARLLGWEVPHGLIDAGDLYAQDGMRLSAASTVVLAGDFDAARSLVGRALRELPLAQMRGDLRLALDKEVPGRSGEINTLLARCVTRGSRMLCIQPAGHSVMKNGLAPRMVSLSEPLADRMVDFGGEEIDALGKFLFLDEDGNDWTLLETIYKAIHQAMVVITGDINFRFHALRGSAACRMAYPEWEGWARSLLQGTTGADHGGKPVGAPRDAVAKALSALGHGRTVTFLGYYFPIWPWLRAHELRLQLQDTAVPVEYEYMLFGGTTAVRRKAEERARKRGDAFDRWDWIGRQVAARIEVEPLGDDQPPVVMAPQDHAQSELPALLALTRFGVLRLIETPLATAANRCGLGALFAAEMDRQLDALAPSIEAVWERRGQSRGKRGKESDGRLASGSVGKDFAEHFAPLSPEQLNLFRTCLDVDRRSMLLLPSDSAALQKRIEQLAGCVPKGKARLLVRRPLGSDFAPDPALVERLKEVVAFGDPERDVGRHPLYQIEPVDPDPQADVAGAERNRKAMGRFTGLARATCIAALAAHNCLKGGAHQ